MTREEKARAYDEALKRADSLTEKYGGREFAEYVFPELAESEDEKMINELQGFLDSFGADYFGTGEWQKFHDWLEKQKEQKPAEWSEDLKNELAKKHLDGYIMGREDIMREMRDFLESHFNTQSGTSRRQGNEQH